MAIYSLPALQEVLNAANQRYFKLISSIATPEAGLEKLRKLAETKTENNRLYKGFQSLLSRGYLFIPYLVTGVGDPVRKSQSVFQR